MSAKPDPLRSWTDKTPAKFGLVSFVEKAVAGDSGAYLPPAERVAVVSPSALQLMPADAWGELRAYLASHGFKTLLVTAEAPSPARDALGDRSGLPREAVLGPYPQSTYKLIDGVPSVVPLAGAAAIPAPVIVHQFAGRRPVLAIVASDADRDLLDYATLRNPRPSFALVVQTPASAGLVAAAPARGWLTITAGEWTK